MCIKIAEKKIEEFNCIRIILTSQKISSLEKSCLSIINECRKRNLHISGPTRIPIKSLTITTRKSPCGEGTNTWDKFEIKVFKRVIELYSPDSIIKNIPIVNLNPGIEIEVIPIKKIKRLIN